jgi:hypothetical protein
MDLVKIVWENLPNQNCCDILKLLALQVSLKNGLTFFEIHANMIGMYLRTTQRKNKDGSIVTYYPLAHNIWQPESGHAVAKVIHNFGRADQLDREAVVRLCRSIARVCGLEVHDPRVTKSASVPPEPQAGLPEDIQLISSQKRGVVWMAEALGDRLQIGLTLRTLVRQQRVSPSSERALFATTANRLDTPCSKLGVWERWLQTVYLPSCQGLTPDQMYEAMDFLHRNAAAVEHAVFFHTANLLNLDVALLFYDTTTCSFAIDDADPEETTGLRR